MLLLQIPICFSISYSNYTIKLVNNSTATLEYMRRVRTVFCPDSSRSIINQFRFHSFLCLCLASAHLPYPLHMVFGLQLFGHAVSLRQLRHDLLHAVSRFDNLGTILSYAHPLIGRAALFARFRFCLPNAPLRRASNSGPAFAAPPCEQRCRLSSKARQGCPPRPPRRP